MHIESFSLQPLFDVLYKGRTSFQMKGVELNVEPTEAVVKADRVLTLFMLNTLADNARKFTDREGRVNVSATQTNDYVEIVVEDTGMGMTQEQLDHLFDHKIVEGHGFGLLNCKGIIEKYRKISQIFSVCQIGATSSLGKGSRLFFRLPRGIARLIIVLLSMLPMQMLAQQPEIDALGMASIYSDSAYFSNINGNYERTLRFADTCRYYLNLHYRQQVPRGRYLMRRMGNPSLMPPEIKWFHDSLNTNYHIILDIRNESAVAALALHEWQLYAYNNKVYTQLFKEMSADNTLADYCRTLQQSQTNKRIAVIVLLVLLVMIVPAYFMLYYRHRLYKRFRRERLQQTNIEMADDELRRAELENSNLHVVNAVLDNCLSTLKHETMYYPSRIRQLIDNDDIEPLGEVAGYYRDLYGILIQQAVSQMERIKLHVRPMERYGQMVLGDENMLRYLFEMLRGQVTAAEKDDKYVVFDVTLSAPLSPLSAYLCRQIVRDHGEATNHRGCGISIENQQVKIILPKYNGKL